LPLRASLLALASLGATFAACVPTPFTFEETGTGGGAGSSTTAGGGEGGSPTTSASGTTTSSSSTGTGMSECGEGMVCNDAVPPEWEGPVLILVSSAGGPKPSCPPGGGKPLQDLHSGPLGQFECSPCTNCAMSGATCSAPEVTCWSSPGCQGDVFNVSKAGNSDCTSIPSDPNAGDQPASCKLTGTPDVLSEGTCTHNGGGVVNAVEWESDVHVCPAVLTGTGDGCGAEGTCEPIQTGQLCIRKAGAMELGQCPSGWNLKQVNSFATADDSRQCSPCFCNGISCSGGAYTFYDALGCTGSSMAVNSMADCADVPNTLGSVASSLMPSVGQVIQNGCAGGGQPMGAFTPTGPVTFCCKN
jgi:hypothetical protein